MKRTLLLTLALLIFSINSLAFAQDTARLQVIHNAADPAAETVDIYLNGDLLLNDFMFRQATPYIDAPGDVEFEIGVAPGNSSSVEDVLATIPVTLESGKTFVAIANGVLDTALFAENPEGNSIGFTLYAGGGQEMGMNGSDNVDLKILHGSTDAPAVDILARGVATLVDDAPYGAMTEYLSVPAASYLLDITPANDNSTIVATFSADLSTLGGGAAVVFASGFLTPDDDQNGEAFGILAALPDGTVIELPLVRTARLQVIHNAADPGAESVDIYLNGDLLLNDFMFRAATPYIDAPGNTELQIGVAPAASGSVADAIATIPVTLKAGGTYIAIANGVLNPDNFAANPDGKSTAFELLLKSMTRETGESTENVEFIVVHGATDAPAVDVKARGVGALLENVAYRALSDYLSVPAASYILDIYPAGQESAVASFTADISTLGGGAAVVLASGFLSPADNQSGEAFGLIAVLPDGTVLLLPAAEPTVVSDESSAPLIREFKLSQNYPNPFNPSTTISYSLPIQANVELTVYDILGQKVKTLVNQTIAAGQYEITWDGSNEFGSQVVSGIYYYQLKTENQNMTRKMTLVK